MNYKTVLVRELEVSEYYKVTCPKHEVDLKRVSVLECAYYKCLSSGNNRAIFDEYVALPFLRKPPSGRPEDTFCNFMKLVESMRNCGVESERDDLTVWRGTNWLKDGHHRAAALLWIDPDRLVLVNELEDNPPKDHNQCSNPCS